MYADYSYYTDSYGGTMPEDEYRTYGLRASDFLDIMTRRQMRDNLPSDGQDLRLIRTAACAVADAMKTIQGRQKELAGSVSGGGTVKSVSSGGESLSFELSALDQAISGGQNGINRYLYDTAKVYLSGVADDNGHYYLFWGIL